jgi:metal-responsive CopG/Arc/MetJ family transcriptional regulator
MNHLTPIAYKVHMMQETYFTEIIRSRLPEGTSARIDRVLKGGELRSAFVRAAVEAELQRREAATAETPAAAG